MLGINAIWLETDLSLEKVHLAAKTVSPFSLRILLVGDHLFASTKSLFIKIFRFHSVCSQRNNFLIGLFYVDAQKIADKFRCKYIETSVVLNHNIDELLVGVVRKVIQRREGGKKQTTTEDYQSSKSPSFTRRMLNKLKKFGQSKDKSTNLYD